MTQRIRTRPVLALLAVALATLVVHAHAEDPVARQDRAAKKDQSAAQSETPVEKNAIRVAQLPPPDPPAPREPSGPPEVRILPSRPNPETPPPELRVAQEPSRPRSEAAPPELRLAQQPPRPNPPNKNRPAPFPAPEGDGQRDPTNVRPDLRPVLDPPPASTGAGSNIAVFRLRGRVGHASGKAAGILDVNGQLFLVQEGSQIDTVIGTNTEITVNVKKFGVEGVVLEVEQTGKTIRLR